jgi:vitamin B12 transporter
VGVYNGGGSNNLEVKGLAWIGLARLCGVDGDDRDCCSDRGSGPTNRVIQRPTQHHRRYESHRRGHAGQSGGELDHRHHGGGPRTRSTTDGACGSPRSQCCPDRRPRGVTYVYIRGADYDQVKVLIDGIDVSNPVDANLRQAFDFSQLLTGDIERIEILRGPQSGFYGSDAIGGVSSITTKTDQGPPKVTAEVEGGSFGTFNQKAGLSGSQDQLSYDFSVQHFQSASTPVTPVNTLLPGEQRVNDFYDNKSFSGKVIYSFNGDDVPFPFTDAGASSQGIHQSFSRGQADWSLFDGKFKNYFGAAYSYIVYIE